MATSQPSMSPIASRTKKCVELFERLNEVTHQPDEQRKDTVLTSEGVDGLGRFRIWAGNIGAFQRFESKSSLDYRLRDARKIVLQIVSLLDDLAESLEDACSIVSNERANRTSSNLEIDPLQVNDGEDKGLEDGNELSEIKEIFSSITETINSLFRYAKATAASQGDPISDQFDINHVREKFPALETKRKEWLISRLGKAITQRRQYLKYCREHHQKTSADFITPKLQTLPKDLELTPMQPATKAHTLSGISTLSKPPSTLAQTQASTLILNSSQTVEEDVPEDSQSQTSYATSNEEESSTSVLHVVQLEDVSKGLNHFECSYCWQIQAITSQRAWKKHVLSDLKPYVCTYEDCDMKLFSDRHTWFSHELKDHRREWSCRFCTRQPFESIAGYQEHLSNRHPQSFTQDQLPALLEMSQHALGKVSPSDCPFCDDWEQRLRSINTHIPLSDTLVVTQVQFKHHVGAHMEQLALFAIPRGYTEVGDAGSANAAPGSNLSLPSYHRVDPAKSKDAEELLLCEDLLGELMGSNMIDEAFFMWYTTGPLADLGSEIRMKYSEPFRAEPFGDLSEIARRLSSGGWYSTAEEVKDDIDQMFREFYLLAPKDSPEYLLVRDCATRVENIWIMYSLPTKKAQKAKKAGTEEETVSEIGVDTKVGAGNFGDLSDADPPNYSNAKESRPVGGLGYTIADDPDSEFRAFFTKPHLREAALERRRSSGSWDYAWGYPVPDVPNTDFKLPEEYKDENLLKAHRGKRKDSTTSKYFSQKREQWLRWKAENFVQNPTEDSEDTVLTYLKIVDEVPKFFRKNDELEELYAFVECYDLISNIGAITHAEKPTGYHHEYNFKLVDQRSREVYDLASAGTIGERVGPNRIILIQRDRYDATIPDLGDLEILVCEETPGSLDYLRKQLNNLGLFPSIICHYERGQDKIATTSKADIIFADILFPRILKTYDLTRNIRDSLNVNQKTPVVAVTECRDELTVIDLFDAVLEKSSGEPQLSDIISRLCTAARVLATSMESTLGDPTSLAFDYLQRTICWWRSRDQFFHLGSNVTPVALERRVRVLLSLLSSSNLKALVRTAQMHVEHEVLNHSYVNKQTLAGNHISEIPHDKFLVTEDGYAWDMTELCEAIASKGATQNPMSNLDFTRNDIVAILNHPLGAHLKYLVREEPRNHEELPLRSLTDFQIDTEDTSDRCIFCGLGEEHDHSEEFEIYLACIICGNHAHQQCAQDANTMKLEDDVGAWYCPKCLDDHRILQTPSPHLQRAVKPESRSVSSPSIAPDDSMDNSRLVRSEVTSFKKSSSAEDKIPATEAPVSGRERVTIETSDPSPSLETRKYLKEDHISIDASATAPDRKLRGLLSKYGGPKTSEDRDRLNKSGVESDRPNQGLGNDPVLPVSLHEAGTQWPMDSVLLWLANNHFSSDWQETFKALKICGSVFLELGTGNGGRGNLSMMHSQIYPRLARECSMSGTGWDQAREREEGKRMRRLIKGIVPGRPIESSIPEAEKEDTARGGSKTSQYQIRPSGFENGAEIEESTVVRYEDTVADDCGNDGYQYANTKGSVALDLSNPPALSSHPRTDISGQRRTPNRLPSQSPTAILIEGQQATAEERTESSVEGKEAVRELPENLFHKPGRPSPLDEWTPNPTTQFEETRLSASPGSAKVPRVAYLHDVDDQDRSIPGSKQSARTKKGRPRITQRGNRTGKQMVSHSDRSINAGADEVVPPASKGVEVTTEEEIELEGSKSFSSSNKSPRKSSRPPIARENREAPKLVVPRKDDPSYFRIPTPSSLRSVVTPQTLQQRPPISHGQDSIVSYDRPAIPRRASEDDLSRLSEAKRTGYGTRQPLSTSAYYQQQRILMPSYPPPSPTYPRSTITPQANSLQPDQIQRLTSTHGARDAKAQQISVNPYGGGYTSDPERPASTRASVQAPSVKSRQELDYESMPPPPRPYGILRRPNSDYYANALVPQAYRDSGSVPVEQTVAWRPIIQRSSVSYDFPESGGVRVVEVDSGRRGTSHYDPPKDSTEQSDYDEKLRQAASYQEDIVGPMTPLTTEALKRQQRRHAGSSRSTVSSASRDESDYRTSATTRTTRAGSEDDENVTIKVTGTARVMVGGAQVSIADGGEIEIKRQESIRDGSVRAQRGSDSEDEGTQNARLGDRPGGVDRPIRRPRTSSRSYEGYTRTTPRWI